MILLDTCGLLAALFPDQRRHDDCAGILRESNGPFVVSPFVLAELDYLVTKLAGVEVETELLAEIERGAYDLATFSSEDVGAARRIIEQFRDLELGLADASTVVLARRLGIRDVLTLDERHFRLLPGPDGNPLRLLPADR